MRWIILLQTAVGATLLAAGVSKLATRGSLRPFLDDLGLPPLAGAAVSRAVPVLEVACGILLLAGVAVWPAVGAAALTVLFTVTLAVAWHAGVLEGCRCFGSLDSGTFSPVSLARALALAVAGVILLVLHLRAPAGSTRLAADGGTAVALGLGAGIAAAYLAAFALTEVVWNFHRRRLAHLTRRFAVTGRESAVPARQPITREEVR
jgi:uncharacterized membrane protein YphA (DoxX/SURF4 family)